MRLQDGSVRDNKREVLATMAESLRGQHNQGLEGLRETI